MKNIILFYFFIISPLFSQEGENIVDEVIVPSQDVYDLLKKINSVYQKNATYKTFYKTKFHITNRNNEIWIDFIGNIQMKSLHTINDSVWSSIFRHDVFFKKPMSDNEVKYGLLPYSRTPLFDKRYFISQKKDTYQFSINSSDSLLFIAFRSIYEEGILTINRLTYHPISLEKKILIPYKDGITNVYTGDKHLLKEELEWEVPQKNTTIKFQTDKHGKIYIKNWFETKTIDNFIYTAHKKNRDRPTAEVPFSFTSIFSMQYIP